MSNSHDLSLAPIGTTLLVIAIFAALAHMGSCVKSDGSAERASASEEKLTIYVSCFHYPIELSDELVETFARVKGEMGDGEVSTATPSPHDWTYEQCRDVEYAVRCGMAWPRMPNAEFLNDLVASLESERSKATAEYRVEIDKQLEKARRGQVEVRGYEVHNRNAELLIPWRNRLEAIGIGKDSAWQDPLSALGMPGK